MRPPVVPGQFLLPEKSTYALEVRKVFPPARDSEFWQCKCTSWSLCRVSGKPLKRDSGYSSTRHVVKVDDDLCGPLGRYKVWDGEDGLVQLALF